MAVPHNHVNLKKAEETAQMLSEAINTGDKAEAIQCVEQLLILKVPVCMRLTQEAYSQACIRLRVGVEDALSDAYITMSVTPGMTISELKQKISQDYGFHPSVQCWIIGKRFAKDEDTLFSHNVTSDDDQAFVFIRSAHSVNLSREQQKQEEQDKKIGSIIENIEVLSRGTSEPGARCKQTQGSPVRKPCPVPPPKPAVGWSCLQCTYRNKPTRPGCAMCSAERPENYKIPDIYKPDEEEARRLQREELASIQYEQSIIEEREKNFLTLIETDNQDLVRNSEEFSCPICCEDVQAGQGATLRECLHSFCRECVKLTILNCMDAEVVCPYADGEYSCNCMLQDREIKTLLSPDEYQKFLELRLNIAESRSENSYHCKTLDCPGWCIFEDDVNEFACNICKETNCLLCKAIHKDMNCKEYQDDLRLRAENDAAAKQTTEILEMMLQNGEAMYCPKCKVIIQKKDGCDWICCLMCKTEICWVTKQARWGPQGHGDTSGGCKCRINVAPCHPNCQNCH
ncbi:ranBP-type and C3HC4-type zinc finger-containing protein 1 isoform X1 [Tachysurus vachellii]|uniref:ranBP-type and C3HC4-type zinc finger-containing protein 1 isoform X1 n=1 Tax=Tachysurus vachellii TaxID=175792 RepID=UPI00296ACBE6|nr:ranBP-type and C3HC4-type zinc finger-containing protein 1 isoform X1 [Tachysurus vachellii]